MMLEPPLMPPAPPVEQERGAFVFFSYAHRDKGFRDRLEEHLSNLKYRGLITTWYDREISAGEEWAQQIDIYLNKAHIILLLISASFMASEYCYSIEMRRALERCERQEADVIPILLRPVLYTDAPFAKLQMLPSNGKPVVRWRDRDSAFVDIAYAIERVAQKYLPPAQTIPSLPVGHAPPALGQASTPSYSPHAPPPQVPPTPAPSRPSGGRRIALIVVAAIVILAGIIAAVAIPLHNNQVANDNAAATANAQSTTQAHTTATPAPILTATSVAAITATPASTPVSTPTATPTATPASASIATPAPIIILGLLLLAGIAALIAIGAIRAKIGQRRAQGAFEEARKRGYYEETIDAYRRALLLNPSDGNAYRGMGNALFVLERYNEALDAFTRAIDCDSTPAAYAGLGDVFARLKRYSEAVAAYEKAIELDPTVTLNHGDLMQALLALGRKEEAERIHARAKQLGYEDQE